MGTHKCMIVLLWLLAYLDIRIISVLLSIYTTTIYEKDKAFVSSMITLAKELNIQTIAEFVENEEIIEVLDTLKIDYYQGWHIGRPAQNFTNLK